MKRTGSSESPAEIKKEQNLGTLTIMDYKVESADNYLIFETAHAKNHTSYLQKNAKGKITTIWISEIKNPAGPPSNSM